jgi:hypothetical protein
MCGRRYRYETVGGKKTATSVLGCIKQMRHCSFLSVTKSLFFANSNFLANLEEEKI